MTNQLVTDEILRSNQPFCPRCRRSAKQTPPCTCRIEGGGGSGGGDGQTSDQSEEKNRALKNVPPVVLQPTAPVLQENTEKNMQPSLQLVSLLVVKMSVIAELISKKLVRFENNKELGILNMELLLPFNALTPAQQNEFKKLMTLLVAEIDNFKAVNNLLANYRLITRDPKGNIISLHISLPTPTLFNKFIAQLAHKNLLPKNPSAPKPSFSGGKAAVRDDEEEKHQHIRPKSILDGLKRK